MSAFMINGTKQLTTYGICSLPGIYTPAEIIEINRRIDPILEMRASARRAYVHPEELLEAGAFQLLFTPRLMDALFAIMPDPVLYHCHVYEIAANDDSPHIFGDSLKGWHRDNDSAYLKSEPTHVSLFVYLTTVGAVDGAFEFVPSVPPTKWLLRGSPYISVTGSPGFSFAWSRKFYHRASPNRGPVRRRLFKISIQKNRYHSVHLGNPHFQRLIAAIPSGDPRVDVLLGRYQGKGVPEGLGIAELETAWIGPTGALNLTNTELAKAQLREKVASIKQTFRGGKQDVVAYD